MDSTSDRNPSPPPEILEQLKEFVPDRIGDSVYSRHWIIQVVIRILEYVEKVEPQRATNNVEFESAEASDDIREIDKKIEEDACTLWDMSANKDVATFLLEFNVAELAVEIIEKTKCPRLVEIIVGILGNIAFYETICDELTKYTDLLNTITPLVGSSDMPTVIQVLRLIRTCIVNESSKKWKNALKRDITFMNYVRFILENSLNGEALKGALQLLYYVLDEEISSCKIWAEERYVKSFELAAKQLLSNEDEAAIGELWLLLNLLCQEENCIASIGNHCSGLTVAFTSYIDLVSKREITFSPRLEQISAIAAGFTTFGVLAKGNAQCLQKFNDSVFLETIEKMQKTCQEMVSKAQEHNVIQGSNNGYSSHSEDSDSQNSHHSPTTSNDYIDKLVMLDNTIEEFSKLVKSSSVEDQLNEEEKG